MEKERIMNENAFAINDFPNEVLGIIFDRLPFADLLRASRVCTRWNSIVTRFCGHRIILRIRTDKDVNFLQRFRNHKHIAIDCRLALDFGVKVDRVMDWMDWLEEVGPMLTTMDIKINASAFGQLAQLGLVHLRELRLEVPLWRYKMEDTGDLQRFFSGLNRLKVARISASSALLDQLTECIFSMNSVERLQLAPTDFCRVKVAGIHNMVHLFELEISCGGVIDCSPKAQSLPSLKLLRLFELNPNAVSKLEKLFPNLTSLEIATRPITTICLHQIVTTWPGLERLSIQVASLDGVIKDLRRLPDLRRLRLNLEGTKPFGMRSSFRLLKSLLGIRSLHQLHFFGHGDFSIPDRNPGCKLYLNGRLVAR